MSRFRASLWTSAPTANFWQRILTRIGRYGFALARDLFDGQISMRAMSLVYTTLLSLVPFLALGFSVLKALGVHNTLEPLLFEFLRPLGPQAEEITGNVIGFVEKIQVGVLGSLGVALLFYTAISLIQKVEASFNFIWRIERPRPFAQRVGEYLGVLMVGPVVVFSALGVTASVLNSEVVTQIKGIEPFGFLLYGATRLIPYALIVGMFTFMYAYVPNTRVRIRAAAIGGLAAGVLWQTASLAFASFVAGATNYNAIYSGFAILIFLLIWLYVGWLILLIGCQLAFYVQHPAHMRPERILPLPGCRETEFTTLMVMSLTGRRFLEGRPPLTQEELAHELGTAPERVAFAVETLITAGFLTETGQSRTKLIPARDLESVSLGALWQAIRGGTPSQLHGQPPYGNRVVALIEDAESRFMERHSQTSLRQWLRET